jgi:protein ATS1
MTNTFKLFALGSNGSGQLGIGHENDTAIPEKCEFNEEDLANIRTDDKIARIVAGGNHTLVLFESGVVFAAGSNEHGQCGQPSRIVQTSIFRRVVVHDDTHEELLEFIDISATWEASFLLGRNGCVYVFGGGEKGELGLGRAVTVTGDLSRTRLVVVGGSDSKVKKLYSGMRHTIAVGDGGQVFGWGSCRKGELGPDLEHLKAVWIPERLNVPFECQKAVLGRNFTIVFSTDRGKVLSQDRVLQEMAEKSVQLLKGDVEAGWSTVYSTVDGHVQGFGRNDRGQWPSEDLPDLSKLAAGSEHCLGLTADGHVVAWGWGEHGNCGQPTDLRGNVAGWWNVLSIPLEDDEEVVSIAAACATSFIVIKRKP